MYELLIVLLCTALHGEYVCFMFSENGDSTDEIIHDGDGIAINSVQGPVREYDGAVKRTVAYVLEKTIESIGGSALLTLRENIEKSLDETKIRSKNHSDADRKVVVKFQDIKRNVTEVFASFVDNRNENEIKASTNAFRSLFGRENEAMRY